MILLHYQHNLSNNLSKDDLKEDDLKLKTLIGEDLKTSNAITLLYDLLKSNCSDGTKRALISSWDQVLSLYLIKEDTITDIHYIEEKIEERRKAKENKDYQLADAIRNELESQGILLKDTKDGTLYELR